MSHYTGSVPDHERTDWRDQAACVGEDPELFFPVGTNPAAMGQEVEAKAVCHRCPVMDVCLQWALEAGQETGVWGGLSEDERRRLKRRKVRRDPAAEASAAEAPAPKKPRPKTGPRTLASIRDDGAVPFIDDDGSEHVLWCGKRNYSLAGRSYSFRQVAFATDRGRLSEGRVLTECHIDDCVHPQHISDEQERTERAALLVAELESPGPVHDLEQAAS